MDEESVGSLAIAGESPDNEVVTENPQRSEPPKRLTDEQQLREELEDDMQQVYAKLKLHNRGSDLGPGPFVPLFRGLLPRSKLSQVDECNSAVSDISKHLVEQRHQLALDHKNVQIENLTLDKRHLQEQWNSSLSRAESLAAELKTLQETLTQAQWGVVQYHNKCDKQRRQLGDVQIANANLKRENARLRDDVKRLRRRAREAEEALAAAPEEVKGSCIGCCEADLDSCKTESSGWESRRTCNQDEPKTLIRTLEMEHETTQSREAMRQFLSRHAGTHSSLDSLWSEAQRISSSASGESRCSSDDGHGIRHASIGLSMTG